MTSFLHNKKVKNATLNERSSPNLAFLFIIRSKQDKTKYHSPSKWWEKKEFPKPKMGLESHSMYHTCTGCPNQTRSIDRIKSPDFFRHTLWIPKHTSRTNYRQEQRKINENSVIKTTIKAVTSKG